MNQSIWSKDLAGKGPRSVKTIIGGCLASGALYCLGGASGAVMVMQRPNAPVGGVLFLLLVAGLGVLGIVSGVAVWRRTAYSLRMARVYAIAFGAANALGLAVVLTSAARTGFQGLLPIALAIYLAISIYRAISDPETLAYVAGERT